MSRHRCFFFVVRRVNIRDWGYALACSRGIDINMNKPRRIVCPQCGHSFPAPEIGAYKVTRVTEVEPRLHDAVRADAGRLARQATGRVLALERAEVIGELNAIRKLVAERRAAIADLKEEEAALRKKLRELEVR